MFVTDEDPRGQNVSIKSVFAMRMLKKVSVHRVIVLNFVFVTDEDPRGQNVSMKSVFAMRMLKKVSAQFNTVA